MPGWFKSKTTASLYETEEKEREVEKGFPMHRFGAMEDIAGLTILLASKAGGYLTGVVIPCDGSENTIG